MAKYPYKLFFGFAIMVDLRNFSEICRRLLIRPVSKRDEIDEVKRKIYSVIFDWLCGTVQSISSGGQDIRFHCRHTGDGFLFITEHQRSKRTTSIDSFLLLLYIHRTLNESVPKLNSSINDLLWLDDNQIDGPPVGGPSTRMRERALNKH